MTVHDPDYRQAVTRTLAALPRDRVLSAATYWSTGSPRFAGVGGHETYAVLRLAGGTGAAQMKTYQSIGGVAILGSFTALRLLTLVADVSIYSINVTTILGLGLAIDYGLFMVARFREELGRGRTTEAALAATIATAGRTVAVSGVTVALALASLMLFPEMLLRSLGRANWWAAGPLRKLYARYGIKEAPDPSGQVPAPAPAGIGGAGPI
jgi:hypothetical protein